MPFKNFEDYAKAEGYCCPLHLLADRVEWDNSVLAEDAGVTERAIRFWRLDYSRGKVQCKNNARCLLIRAVKLLPQEPQTTPEYPDKGSDTASEPASPAR